MAIGYIGSSSITDTNYQSTTIPVPTGADSSSWLIITWFAPNAPAGVATPDGFTKLHSGIPTSAEADVVLVGQTADSSVTLSLADDSTSWMSARCVAYSGAGGVDASAFADTSEASADSPAVSLTTTHDGDMLVLTCINDSGANPTAPSGFTRRVADGSTPMVISDKTQATAGASGSITQTWAQSGNQSIGLIALKSAGEAPTVAIDPAGPLYISSVSTPDLEATTDSTSATYGWTVESGPAGTFSADDQASTTFTPSGAGTYDIRCTVTDSNGSGHADVTITATTAARTAGYVAVDTTGWTVTGGASATNALTDSDGGTYLASGDDPDGLVITGTLSAWINSGSGKDATLTLGIDELDAASSSVTATIKQADTTIWTGTKTGLPAGTAGQDVTGVVTFTVPAANLADITDPDALTLELSVSAAAA